MNIEEIVDKIIRGESLNESESKWWEENQNNLEVQQVLEFHQNLQDPLRIEHRKLLKNQLQELEQQSGASSQSVSQGKIFRTLTIAASFAIIAVVAIFLWQKSDDQALNNIEPFPNIINPVKKGNVEINTLLDSAMMSYENQSYDEALTQFGQIEEKNDTISFYEANALLQLSRPDAALSILRDLSKRDHRFSRESSWFESLALWQLNRRDEAKRILQSIAISEGHPYREEARLLLERLQR